MPTAPFVLRPVVASPPEPSAFWCPLPPKPWPDFIELSGSSTDGEVALVLLQLATYNRGRQLVPLQPAELVSAESLVLPGGLQATNGTQVISPSCCCGLEGWPEWRYALEDGTSPWMGHDPFPWLEQQEGQFQLWPDEITPERPPGTPIRFTQAELEAQLSGVPGMLGGFLARVREVLLACAPADAEVLAARFDRTFVRRDAAADADGPTP